MRLAQLGTEAMLMFRGLRGAPSNLITPVTEPAVFGSTGLRAAFAAGSSSDGANAFGLSLHPLAKSAICTTAATASIPRLFP